MVAVIVLAGLGLLAVVTFSLLSGHNPFPTICLLGWTTRGDHGTADSLLTWACLTRIMHLSMIKHLP